MLAIDLPSRLSAEIFVSLDRTTVIRIRFDAGTRFLAVNESEERDRSSSPN
jgi:hypothetical protein